MAELTISTADIEAVRDRGRGANPRIPSEL